MVLILILYGDIDIDFRIRTPGSGFEQSGDEFFVECHGMYNNSEGSMKV